MTQDSATFKKRRYFINKRIQELKLSYDFKTRKEAVEKLGIYEYKKEKETDIKHRVIGTLQMYLKKAFEDNPLIRKEVAKALGKIPYWLPEDENILRKSITELKIAMKRPFEPDEDVRLEARNSYEHLSTKI